MLVTPAVALLAHLGARRRRHAPARHDEFAARRWSCGRSARYSPGRCPAAAACSRADRARRRGVASPPGRWSWNRGCTWARGGMAADRRQGPAAAVRQRNGDQQCAFLTHAIEEEAQLDHTLHERLEATELTEANLINATIYGPDDETIGSVSHVHGSGADAQVIVDVGGLSGDWCQAGCAAGQPTRFHARRRRGSSRDDFSDEGSGEGVARASRLGIALGSLGRASSSGLALAARLQPWPASSSTFILLVVQFHRDKGA